MKIYDISIKNFRGIKSLTKLKSGDINSFVGKNDSGKSSVLKALDAFFNDKFTHNDVFKGISEKEKTEITIRFESSEVIDDMKGLIDAVNIDLKCFSQSYYKSNLGGNLNQVLQNLKHFKKNDIWLEITTLLVPGKNDSKDELEKIAKFIKEELDEFTPWHISSFHPDYKDMHIPHTSIDSLQMAYKIGKEAGLNYV